MQYLPNYSWKGNVNLMATIRNWCWNKSEYEELDLLKSEDLNEFQNVVLFVVDALWYERINTYGKWSFLEKNCIWKSTSVFPSTTSTAVTSFLTWVPWQEHCILWRNMWLKEISAITQILPRRTKIWKFPLQWVLKPEDVFVKPNFFSETSKDIFVITHKSYGVSDYNNYYNKNSKILYYEELHECFKEVLEAVNYNENKKYIYSYWAMFDDSCHTNWIDSNKVLDHFRDIDHQFKKLAENLKWTNTLILVTADHWQINIPQDKKIILNNDHSSLLDMLFIPLAWDNRCQYCFVKEWKHKEFREYVKKNLSHACEIFDKNEILEKNIYWIWKASKKFLDRIWDFVIIAKENYALYDITGWKVDEDIWHHWWMTKEEIFVPIVRIDCK